MNDSYRFNDQYEEVHMLDGNSYFYEYECLYTQAGITSKMTDEEKAKRMDNYQASCHALNLRNSFK